MKHCCVLWDDDNLVQVWIRWRPSPRHVVSSWFNQTLTLITELQNIFTDVHFGWRWFDGAPTEKSQKTNVPCLVPGERSFTRWPPQTFVLSLWDVRSTVLYMSFGGGACGLSGGGACAVGRQGAGLVLHFVITALSCSLLWSWWVWASGNRCFCCSC